MTSGCPADQVMWPLTPVPGESLLSWVARTARHNVHASPYTLLRRCGLAYESRPYAALDGDIDRVRLARALGAAVDEVSSRMFSRSDTAGFVMLDGVEVRRNDLITAVRRFSARSVDARKIHAGQAMYRMLPFCPESWEYLLDACSTCGQLQRWRHAWALDRCDGCSTPLSESRGAAVARSLRPALAALSRIIGPDRALRHGTLELLPPELRHLDPGAAIDLACSLALICDPRLPVDRPPRIDLRDQRRLASALAAAWRVMLEWPVAFDDLVRRTVADSRAHTGGRVGEDRGVARQRLLNLLQSRDRVAKLPQIVRLMDRTLEAYGGGEDSAAPGNLLVKPAARRLGITEGEASRGRDEGLLVTRLGISNGRILLNFDAAEIERLEKVRRTRLGAYAVGSRLRIPTYAVERLVERSLLDVEDHPWLVERFGAAVITEDAVKSIQDRLVGMACSQGAIADRIELSMVMKRFGGGPKPWETVFGMLLTGSLRFCILGPQIDARTIFIGDADARRCLTLAPGAGRKTFSQADALEILNLLPKHGSALERLRTANDISPKWEIDGAKLIRAAKRYVSYSELISRTGLYPRTIRESLLTLGCPPPGELGWLRLSAMSRLRDLR